MASEQDVIESLGIQITSSASGATKSLNTLNKGLERLINNLTTVQSKSNVKGLGNVTTQTQKTTTATNNANKSFNTFGNTLSRTSSKSKNLAYAFGKFYANCFMLIRGVKKLGSAIESSMDYIETYNYFNVTMDKIGTEWSKDYKKWGYDNAEAYGKSFQERIEALNTKLTGYTLGENGEATYTGEKNLGMNIEQMMNFQASVGAVTNSLGIMGETSVNTQKAMSMLATDLSSFKNIDISSVMTNLQSGLIGQSRSLYKYGIDITNATLQTYAYANGISKAITEMTQGEKMQLRLLAILDQSRIAWGDQANTVNSVANQYRILKEQFGNLSRTIGSIFIPIVEKVLPIVNGLVIGMNKLLQTFGISVWGDNWLSDIMSGTSAGYSDDALGDLADDSEDLADELGTAGKNAKKLKNNLLGIDKLNIISKEDTSSSSSSGSSSGSGNEIDLSKQIAASVANYEKVWEQAFKNSENLAQKYANRIVKAFQSGDWKSVGQYWSKKLENTLKNIEWDKVYKKASGFGKGLANFLNGLITPSTFYQVGKTVASSLNTAIKAKLSFGQTFDWENLGLSIANGINGFFENYNFDDLANTIDAWVQGIWTTLKTAILNVKWGEVFKGIGEFLTNIDIETVGLIIGYIVIKKILGLHLLSGALSILGSALSKAIAGDAGIKAAASSGLSKVLAEMAITFKAGLKGLFGSKAAVSALSFMSKSAKLLTGIGSVIAGVALAASNFIKMLKNGFNWISEILMVVGVGLAAVGAVILGVPAAIAAVVAGIVAAIATIVVVVKDNWEAIKGFFVNLWEGIKEIFGAVGDWFNTHVITPIVTLFNGVTKRIGQFFKGCWIIIKAVWKVVSGWFSEHVIQPIIDTFKPIIEKVSGVFKSAWNTIKDIFKTVAQWFKKNVIQPVSKAFTTVADKIKEIFNGIWDGVKGGIVGAVNGLIGIIEGFLNLIVGAINGFLKGFNKVVKGAAKIVGEDWNGVDLIKKVELTKIQTYATGGFPEDGWFRATKGEFFGQFDDGTSYIANNKQIQNGIATGVEDAAYRGMLRAIAQGNSQAKEQTIIVQSVLDGRVIAQSTNRYNANKGANTIGYGTGYL